jgi:hypothetical protein
LDFIDENDDEFADRVMTVLIRKNVSFEGFRSTFGVFWSWQAYRKQFIKPDLKKTYEAFKELVKTGISAEEILTKMLKQDEMGWIHRSLVELLEDDCRLWDNRALDLKVSEMLELIHTKGGYPECAEDEHNRCKLQREKLKKKP